MALTPTVMCAYVGVSGPELLQGLACDGASVTVWGTPSVDTGHPSMPVRSCLWAPGCMSRPSVLLVCANKGIGVAHVAGGEKAAPYPASPPRRAQRLPASAGPARPSVDTSRS